jgi:hypothetical protein
MQDETGGPGWVDDVAEGVLKHTFTAILICFQGSSAGGWDLMFFLWRDKYASEIAVSAFDWSIDTCPTRGCLERVRGTEKLRGGVSHCHVELKWNRYQEATQQIEAEVDFNATWNGETKVPVAFHAATQHITRFHDGLMSKSRLILPWKGKLLVGELRAMRSSKGSLLPKHEKATNAIS